MKNLFKLIPILLLLFSDVGEVNAVPAQITQQSVAEWPQVQNNAARTGLSTETLGTNFAVKWTHPFQPEKIFPQVQAIVSGGEVFVGTEMGNMYAFNATNGAQLWKFSTGGPILASAAVSGTRVYFGSMDGAVYALDTASGGQVWKAQLSTYTGFSSAPVIADGKIMIGGRNGIFYGLDPASGSAVWQFNAGSPILMTPAWDNGRAYFGAMDMRVYAVNSVDGSKAWNSVVIPGMTFKDYWPVVTQGMVYVRTMTMSSLGLDDSVYNNAINPGAEQTVLNNYDAHPDLTQLSMFRLVETSGAMGSAVIHYNWPTMNGTTTPPCVTPDGHLVMPSYWHPSATFWYGWGLLNVSSRIMDRALTSNPPPTGIPPAGFGNRDENLNVSCSANLVLVFHTEEENAQFTGAFNLNTNQWTHIEAGQTNRQMANNTQGAGGNPASVANGMVFHITMNELIARSTN